MREVKREEDSIALRSVAEKEAAGLRDPGVVQAPDRGLCGQGMELGEGEDSRLWLGGRRSMGILRRHTSVLLRAGATRGRTGLPGWESKCSQDSGVGAQRLRESPKSWSLPQAWQGLGHDFFFGGGHDFKMSLKAPDCLSSISRVATVHVSLSHPPGRIRRPWGSLL